MVFFIFILLGICWNSFVLEFSAIIFSDIILPPLLFFLCVELQLFIKTIFCFAN
jgi:hypothetical protein